MVNGYAAHARRPEPQSQSVQGNNWPVEWDFGDDAPQLTNYEGSVASAAPTPLVTPANSRPTSFDVAASLHFDEKLPRDEPVVAQGPWPSTTHSTLAVTIATEYVNQLRQAAELHRSDSNPITRVSRQLAIEMAEKRANSLAAGAGLEAPFPYSNSRANASVRNIDTQQRGFLNFWKRASLPVDIAEESPLPAVHGNPVSPSTWSATESTVQQNSSPAHTVTPATLASSLGSLSVSSRKFRRRGAIPFSPESGVPPSPTVAAEPLPTLRSPFNHSPSAVASQGGQKAEVCDANEKVSTETLIHTVELAEVQQKIRRQLFRADHAHFMRIVQVCKETLPGTQAFTERFDQLALPADPSTLFWAYWQMAEEVGREEGSLAFESSRGVEDRHIPEVFYQPLQSRRERLAVRMRYIKIRGETYSCLSTRRMAEMRQHTKRMEDAWEAQKRKFKRARGIKSPDTPLSPISSVAASEGVAYCLPTAANIALVGSYRYSKRVRVAVWTRRMMEQYDPFKAELATVPACETAAPPSPTHMTCSDVAALHRPVLPPPGETAEQRIQNRAVYDLRMDISFARQAMGEAEVAPSFGDDGTLDCGIDSVPFEDEAIELEGPSSAVRTASVPSAASVEIQTSSGSVQKSINASATDIAEVAEASLPVTPPKLSVVDTVTPPSAQPSPSPELSPEQKRTIRNRKKKEAKKRAARKVIDTSSPAFTVLEPIAENEDPSSVPHEPVGVFNVLPQGGLRPLSLASKAHSTVLPVRPVPQTPPTPSRVDKSGCELAPTPSKPTVLEPELGGEPPSFSLDESSLSSFDFVLQSPNTSLGEEMAQANDSFDMDFGSSLPRHFGPSHSTPPRVKEQNSLPAVGSPLRNVVTSE